MSVLSQQMRFCYCINLFVLLDKFPFKITHTRLEIEWSDLSRCLATGSPMLLSWMCSVIAYTHIHILYVYIYILYLKYENLQHS